MSQKKSQSGPKTGFGRYMVYTFIPQYANNVQGLVYVGAAILIIIVGLRGLGTAAQGIPMIGFLLDDKGERVDVNWVMVALFLEFLLLLVLSIVTFFTPEEDHGHGGGHGSGGAEVKSSASGAQLKAELDALKSATDEQLKMVEQYVERFNTLNKKISQIQLDSIKALEQMKQTITKS